MIKEVSFYISGVLVSIGNHMNLSVIWEINCTEPCIRRKRNFTRRSRVKYFLQLHGECNYFPKFHENSCDDIYIPWEFCEFVYMGMK